MFKKSLLAAALLLAGGTAVNAAEIGVRHTTGNTYRDIFSGTSTYVREVTGTYSEDSSGFALGISADGFEVVERSDADSFSDTFGSTEGTFAGTAAGTVEIASDGGPQNWAVGGSAPAELGIQGTFEGTSDEFTRTSSWSRDELEVDGDLRVSGTLFTRHESGSISETVNESYDFFGYSDNSFSELSTFSR